MKLKITNLQTVTLSLRCKSCNKEYCLDITDLRNVSPWQFENCSRNCAYKKDNNKFLILQKDKRYLKHL